MVETKVCSKPLSEFNKRRGYGCEPLNEWFEGSHFHIDGNHAIGIYIPEELHNSFTGQGMEEMNRLAILYLWRNIYAAE
jgi:hypothetical protein